MQRSALILIVVATATLAVLLWPDPAPAAPPSPAANDPGVSSPSLPSTPPHQGPQQPGPALPADAPRVRVEVTERERFQPPPPSRVSAATADGRELPVQLLAGAGAGFDGVADVLGVALAQVGFEGHQLLRQIALDAGAATRLVVGARFEVGGHVRDEKGEALAGAVIWFGELDADGKRVECVTDDEGQYRSTVPAGDGVPFVVRTDGKAAAWRVVRIAAPVPPIDAVLRPALTLELQLAASSFDADQARAYLVPIGSVSSDVALYPFFEQVLSGGFPFDAGGHAVIEQLPADGELGIVVQHARLRTAAPQRVTLKGTRVRVLVPVQPLAAAWRGRVVDEVGQPVAGAWLWSRTQGQDLAPGNSQRLLPPHLLALGTCCTQSAVDGAFELGANSAADAVLTLRAPGHAGRDVPWRSLTAATPIVLPIWRGGEPEFVLSPPQPDVAWGAETTLGGGVHAALAAGETWRVAFPQAGRFDVTITTFVGERAVASKQLPDLMVTGSVPLTAPQRQ